MIKLKNLQKDVPLAPLTTYQIGGPADYFVEVKSKTELAAAIKAAKEEDTNYFLLGSGANILVGDKGFRGLVIHNQADNFRFEGQDLIAESGAIAADLIEASMEKRLSGLEHFAGIPSSVGGAIWQNLHFLSPDRKSTLYIESIIKSAEVLEDNEVKTVDPEYFKFGYDDSILHHKPVTVLEVTFSLQPGDEEAMRSQIKKNLAWRERRQPQLYEFASCGSVFKKIEGVGAGRLIDEAGLKRARIGDAMISGRHANTIINLGHAKASDVMALIDLAKKTVKEETGHQLETEIGFIGEF